jgi:hypothetical protein
VWVHAGLVTGSVKLPGPGSAGEATESSTLRVPLLGDRVHAVE